MRISATRLTLSRQREREVRRGTGWTRAIALVLPIGLSACGTPNACLANRYDGSQPQARCVSGLQLPYDVLKDTDPMSGSTAPVEPAL